MVQIVEEGLQEPSEDQVVSRTVGEYIRLRSTVKNLQARQASARDTLVAVTQSSGITDDDGHFYLPLSEPVDGVEQVKVERRVSTVLDPETALDIITDRGLFDECTRTVVTVDQDAIMQALIDGKLTAEDVDRMFTRKVTMALVVR